MLSEAGSGAGKGGGGGLGGLGEVEVLTLLNWTLIYLDQRSFLPFLSDRTYQYAADKKYYETNRRCDAADLGTRDAELPG